MTTGLNRCSPFRLSRSTNYLPTDSTILSRSLYISSAGICIYRIKPVNFFFVQFCQRKSDEKLCPLLLHIYLQGFPLARSTWLMVLQGQDCMHWSLQHFRSPVRGIYMDNTIVWLACLGWKFQTISWDTGTTTTVTHRFLISWNDIPISAHHHRAHLLPTLFIIQTNVSLSRKRVIMVRSAVDFDELGISAFPS